ncbi:hypothetical protein TcCL_NonESM12239 [Trypanosoma cruzi]|nr:hypothetical protein TcCL_NonESM12239 [Trypanosoma cruzi]
MTSDRHTPGNASHCWGNSCSWKCRRYNTVPACFSYDTVRKLNVSSFGLGSAFRGGGAIGVPSLALVLAQVAGGGSGGIPGGSGSPGEIDFPQRLGARNATDVGHVRHDTHAATAVLAAHRAVCRASDRGGVGPAGGGGVSVRGSLRACCAASELHQQHVLGMADCSGRSSHP